MYENESKQLIRGSAAAQMSGAAQGYAVGAREIGQAKTSPRDKSTMDMVIDTLSSHISAAEILFQGLSDKLQPILTTADTCHGGDPIRPSSCELEERILNLASRIANLNASMSDINARVCL